MMKNQIFRRLLYLLSVLFWPLISTAARPDVNTHHIPSRFRWIYALWQRNRLWRRVNAGGYGQYR